MSIRIFTLTGCVRCKIVKKYMADNGIDYEEFDMLAEGKDVFAKFYRENRQVIVRNERGVRLPVLCDGEIIRQGLQVAIAYLQFGMKLDGYVSLGTLEKEWCDGFSVSGGDPASADEFLELLSFLKKNQFKIQITTDGKNSKILEKAIEEGLCDRVIMEVKGPLSVYAALSCQGVVPDEIIRSIELVSKCPDHQFHTSIVPVTRQDGSTSYFTIEEIAEMAAMIETSSGSKKNSYTLNYNGEKSSPEPLTPDILFKYRTAARRYQVLTEIGK